MRRGDHAGRIVTEVGSPAGSRGFSLVAENEIYRGDVITVVTGEFLTPEGKTITRDIVRHPGAVSVVPVDGDEIVLVRQYRAAAGREILEIPAGKRDVEGEPPETAAIRELEEEVGFTTGRLVELSRFYNSVGFSDEYSYVYLATDLQPVPTDRQGPEEHHMTIERLALEEVGAAITDGRIEDAKTVIGLLAALRFLGR